MMFLFDLISYKLVSQEIKHISNPGQATSMLGCLSYADDFSTSSGLKYCWAKDSTNNATSFTQSRAIANVGVPAAVPAIPASYFTPIDNPAFYQGFPIRKSFLCSSEPNGCFEFIISFSHIFGFANYNRIMYGVLYTLNLIRGNDNNALYRRTGVDAGKVNLTNISWHIPEVQLNHLYEGAIMEKNKKERIIPY